MGNKKIIILGTAESLKRTPWDKNDYDYWACSPVLSYEFHKGHRIDAVFEIHERQHWNSLDVKKLLNDYVKANPEVKIYMQNAYKEINNSIPYPVEEIRKWVNHDLLGNYFTSTIGMMVALAIFTGQYDRIELWGCHMAAKDEEYSMQRAGVEAWLNYGLGKGIDYWVTPDSEVMKTSYIYGYEQRKDTLLKIMNLKEQIAKGLQAYEKDLEELKSKYWQQKGGFVVMERLINEFK